MTVIGIDGARQGWVGARWSDDGALDVVLETTLTELFDRVGPVDVATVDMPIVLADGPRRAADDAARQLLGPRRSSIFAAPALGALDFADDEYAEANAWSKRTHGVGISKQAWFLVPRIREVRAWAAAAGPDALVECSPELSFLALGGGPVPASKRTWTGLAIRRELLARHGLEPAAELGPAGRCAPDDVLDAIALAWSARRIRDGDAEAVPAQADDGTAVIRW